MKRIFLAVIAAAGMFIIQSQSALASSADWYLASGPGKPRTAKVQVIYQSGTQNYVINRTASTSSDTRLFFATDSSSNAASGAMIYDTTNGIDIYINLLGSLITKGNSNQITANLSQGFQNTLGWETYVSLDWGWIYMNWTDINAAYSETKYVKNPVTGVAKGNMTITLVGWVNVYGDWYPGKVIIKTSASNISRMDSLWGLDKEDW